MDKRGVCYIALGARARKAAKASRKSLLAHNDLPVHVLTAPDIGNLVVASRQAKVTLDRWTPFEQTLYLDADTIVNGNIMAGFDILDAGFDVAIAGSQNQEYEVLHHVAEDEREATFAELKCWDIFQLQGGVIFFRKSAAVTRFFETWQTEWQRWKGQDQGALLRALHKSPLAMWILGRDWNGGALIEHKFGQAR